jgi:hypothetical protein
MLARNKVAIVVVGVGIGVVTAYETATSDAVVSRILRCELAKAVRAPCYFESASFSFLHGLEVRGLTVLDPAEPLGDPLLAAEHSHVNYVLDVFGAGPRVTRIDVDRPRLRVERAPDGTFPAMNVFLVPPPEGREARKPLVHLSDGEVTFSDKTFLSEPIALHRIVIDVSPATPTATDWAHAVIHMTAESDVLGPVKAEAIVGETGDFADVTVDLPLTRIDPSLPGRFTGDIGKRIAEFAPQGEVTAHVKARVAKDHDVVAEVPAGLRGVSFRVALPESEPGQPVPVPIEVTGLIGHVRFADDRLEAHDLVLRALGAEIHVDATLDGVSQSTRTLDANVSVTGLALTREVRASLPLAARGILEAYDITGDVDATATIHGPLASPSVTAKGTVAHGHVRYDGWMHDNGERYGFPWPAEDVTGKVEFDGRKIHVDATGRHGPAKISVKADVDQPANGPSIPNVSILAEEVPLDDSVKNSFHDHGEAVFGKWGPSGVAKSIAIHVYREPNFDPDHDVIEVTVDCDGRAAFLPSILHTNLTGASGRVEILEPKVLEPNGGGHRASLVRLTDVAANGDGFAMRVSGDVRDDRDAHSEDLVVGVDTQDAGGGLRTAALGADEGTIHRGVKDAIRKLGPSGPVGIVAHLVSATGAPGSEEVTIDLHGAAVTGWDDIPLAGRGLTGRAVIKGNVLTLSDIAGFLVMGESSSAFTAHGQLIGLSGTPQFDIHLESPQIPLGAQLRAALGPNLAEKAHEFWASVDPQEGTHAAVVLDLRPEGDPKPFEVRLSGIRGALRPLGLELDCADGSFHYDGSRTQIVGLDAAIGGAVVRVDDADVDENHRVTVHASVRGLRFPEDLEGPISAETVAKIVEQAPGRTMHATDLVLVWEPEVRALEIAGNVALVPRTRRMLRDPGLSPEGTLDVGRLVFYMPEERPPYFQGEAQAEAFSLRAGLAIDRFKGPLEISGTFGDDPEFDLRTKDATLRVQQYPLVGTDALVRMKERGVHVDFTATFMDGHVQGWCGPGKGDVAYQGEARLTRADLEKTIRERSTSVGETATGKLDAAVRFQVLRGRSGGLHGDGHLTAYDAKLMKSPAIGSILRFISGGLLSAELTDAEVKFDLEDDWLDVKDIKVTGSSGSVAITHGEGKVGLADGRLDLVLYVQLVTVPIPLVGQVVNLIATAAEWRFRVTGTLRNPSTESERFIRTNSRHGREPLPEGDVEAPARPPW